MNTLDLKGKKKNLYHNNTVLKLKRTRNEIITNKKKFQKTLIS